MTVVAKEVCGHSAGQTLLEAFPLDTEGISEFNAVRVIFIPKKAPQEQDGREFHASSDARPLTIVNATTG